MSAERTVTFHRQTTACLLTYSNENRNQGCFNDVIIKTDNNQNISANRMVLSCYSEYFDKMFKSQMKEQYQHSVEVKGVDGKTLQVLIDYIYSGQITINSDNVMSLVASADYLQLDEVKEFCFDFMEFLITSDNCFTILNIADLYRSNLLKVKVYEFIGRNYKAVTKSSGFKNLSKADLIFCTSMLDLDRVKQNALCQSILEWTKYNKIIRSTELAGLLKLIDFTKLSIDYLQIFVSNDLIQENLKCVTLLNVYLIDLLKTKMSSESGTKILSLGGRKTARKVFEVYCTSDLPVYYPDLPESLRQHCALKIRNTIYCIGGSSEDEILNKVFVLKLDHYDMKWEETAAMYQERWMFGAAVCRDIIAVAGGRDQAGIQLNSTEILVIDSKKWQPIAPLKHAREGNELVVCDNYLFALGGFDGQTVLKSVERLNDWNWNDVASMLTPRTRFAAVNCGGFIYVIGGKNMKRTEKTVEKYDHVLNLWSYVSSMKVARFDHCACVLHGKIYVIGGYNLFGDAITNVEYFVPSHNKWFFAKPTTEKLDEHAVVVL